MARFFSIVVFFFAANAFAAPGTPVPIDDSRISFTFESQDGDLSYPCTASEADPVSRDLRVVCVRPDHPKDVWNFLVHLRLSSYTHPTPPMQDYELLYWVTDEQAAPASGAKFVGSTIWFNMQNNSPLVSVDASQDIEDTWELRLHIQLQPQS